MEKLNLEINTLTGKDIAGYAQLVVGILEGRGR